MPPPGNECAAAYFHAKHMQLADPWRKDLPHVHTQLRVLSIVCFARIRRAFFTGLITTTHYVSTLFPVGESSESVGSNTNTPNKYPNPSPPTHTRRSHIGRCSPIVRKRPHPSPNRRYVACQEALIGLH